MEADPIVGYEDEAEHLERLDRTSGDHPDIKPDRSRPCGPLGYFRPRDGDLLSVPDLEYFYQEKVKARS